jgi:hypothetical protein
VADAIIGPTLDGKKGRPDGIKGVATILSRREDSIKTSFGRNKSSRARGRERRGCRSPDCGKAC